MNMNDNFSILGKWWLPNNQEKKVPGKLNFSPSSGLELELIESFYESAFKEEGSINIKMPENPDSPVSGEIKKGTKLTMIEPEEKIILGFTENNEEITLYRCFGYIKQFTSSYGITKLAFNAEFAFWKVHLQAEQDINFKSISASYSNLEEWIGISGIQTEYPINLNKTIISYEPPPDIILAPIEGIKVSIVFSGIYKSLHETSFLGRSIEQKTYFKLENSEKKSIDKYVEILLEFQNFISFAASSPSSFISITGKVDINRKRPVTDQDGKQTFREEISETQVSVLFALNKTDNFIQKKPFIRDMLFVYNDMDKNFGRVFEQWIKLQKEYVTIFELFFITIYSTKLYLHYKFINTVQALEVYHSYKYKGKYQETSIYKEGIYQHLSDVIKNFPSEDENCKDGISDDFRNALGGKLHFLNQHTLQTKLNEILEDVIDLFPDNFLVDLEDRRLLVRRVSKTRNALTHHDKEERDKAAKGEELLRLYHTLNIILQVCLLRELNFSEESISKIVIRNRNIN